ncbi:MAG: hypothetical protein KGH60_05165 [Candidatus Micrarchaeota archaeon]|nr:hypothetical protein [Candidatus Micrarchaeota archaeon]
MAMNTTRGSDADRSVHSSVVGADLRTVNAKERVTDVAINAVHSAEPVDMAKLKRKIGNVLNTQQIESQLVADMTTAILNVYGVDDPTALLTNMVKDNISQRISLLVEDLDPKIVSYEVEKQLLVISGQAIEDILRDYTFELGDRREATFKAAQATSLLIQKMTEFLRKERP